MSDNPDLKLLNPSAPLDMLVSYLTDAARLWQDQSPWLAAHHREGERFAQAVAAVGPAVVRRAAALDLEKAEAQAATQAQADAMTQAEVLARKVRRIGAFVAAELELSSDEKERSLARRWRTALGVGLNVNLKRQTGLRRLLLNQKQGLVELGPELSAWKVEAGLADQVDRALERLEQSIEAQSQEQLEADLAQDALDLEAATAVDLYNRAITLTSVFADRAPDALVTGLLSLQGDHPRVFHQKARADEGDEATPAPAPPTSPA